MSTTLHTFDYVRGQDADTGKPIVKRGRFGIRVNDYKVLERLAGKAARSKGKRSQLAGGAIVVEYLGDIE